MNITRTIYERFVLQGSSRTLTALLSSFICLVSLLFIIGEANATTDLPANLHTDNTEVLDISNKNCKANVVSSLPPTVLGWQRQLPLEGEVAYLMDIKQVSVKSVAQHWKVLKARALIIARESACALLQMLPVDTRPHINQANYLKDSLKVINKMTINEGSRYLKMWGGFLSLAYASVEAAPLFAEQKASADAKDGLSLIYVDGIPVLRMICDGSTVFVYTFDSPQHIYGYDASPNGQYMYVWHMEYPPRQLKIFRLSTGEMLADFVPGFGGQIQWTLGDKIIHSAGCGTNCTSLCIYDIVGGIIHHDAISGFIPTPDGYYLAYPTVAPATSPVYKYDVNTNVVTILRDSLPTHPESTRLQDSELIFSFSDHEDIRIPIDR